MAPLLSLVLTATLFPPEGAAAPPDLGLSAPLVAALQRPAPPPAPAPTLDQLIQAVKDVRKQRADLRAKDADLAKQEAAAVAALKAAIQDLRDLLDIIDPKPPTPPAPPQPPADPLAAKLKAAFDGDSSAQKKEQAKDLAALYRQAAKLANDAGVATAGDLLGRVKAASATLVGADALKAVRNAVGGELAAILPTDDPLTDAQRASAAALFAKLATILDTLGAGQ
jgi:hypothetical protein